MITLPKTYVATRARSLINSIKEERSRRVRLCYDDAMLHYYTDEPWWRRLLAWYRRGGTKWPSKKHYPPTDEDLGYFVEHLMPNKQRLWAMECYPDQMHFCAILLHAATASGGEGDLNLSFIEYQYICDTTHVPLTTIPQ